VSANVAKPQDQPNGSSSISYGARYYYGADRHTWGLCMLVGFQQGYSELLNADGLHYNGHLTARSIPIGLAYARAFALGGTSRLTLFVTPQFVFQSHKLDLVSRADTVSVSDNPTDSGIVTGASLKLGPVFIRGSMSKFKSSDSWGWTLGAGVSP
jgi:hypothetical protein